MSRSANTPKRNIPAIRAEEETTRVLDALAPASAPGGYKDISPRDAAFLRMGLAIHHDLRRIAEALESER